MKQLSFGFLESRVIEEFHNFKWVWEAFHYAKAHDPVPDIKRYGDYYVPSTAKEMKGFLKEAYPESRCKINKMTAKQTRMVYHTINKFLSCSNFFKDEQ